MGGLTIWLILGSLGVYGAYGLLVAGLMTNWFRYSLSHEDAILLRHLITISLVVIGMHLAILMLPKRSLVTKIMPFTVTLVAVGILALLMHETHGRYFPLWQTSQLERNGVQGLTMKEGEVFYHLELENPFSSSHREYLILKSKKREIRIALPLFHRSIGGYIPATKPADWCTLEQSGDPNVFILHTTLYLRKASFQIDLADRSAREIDFMKPLPGGN
jgi:hypothetical protein